MKKRLLIIYQNAPFFVKSFISSLYGLKLNRRRYKNRDKYLFEIAQKDKWTEQEVTNWQNDELKKMLDHAVKNVPYYREQWAEIWKTNPGLSHYELKNWPILEKKYIKANPDAFIADNYKDKKKYLVNTSGSTGTPMNFWLDRNAMSYWYAIFEHRIKTLNGINSKDNWANIGGQLIYDINKNKPPYWTWNWSMRQLYLSSYHITAGNVKYYLQALRKYDIRYIISYTSSVFNIAKEGIAQNLKFPKLSAVITNAEPLFQHQRDTITKAFGCPVVQTYAGCEFAFGACENPEQLMYVWPEAGILEVIGEDNKPLPDGEIGNYVCTGLVNLAMPLIRYRIGDSGAYMPSELCKDKALPYPVLKEITGRNDDLLFTPEGKMVGRLDPVFKGDFNIKEAQIIQEELGLIRIKYTPLPGFVEAEIAEVRSRLQDRVGNNVTIITEQVDSIPRSANGKFKSVISMINK